MQLTIPQINPNDEEVILVRFLVEDGDLVRKGDAVVEIETTKVTQELEAPSAGFFRRLAPEGKTLLVGAAYGEIGETEEGSASRVAENAGTPSRKVTRKAEVLLASHGLVASDIPGENMITEAMVASVVEQDKGTPNSMGFESAPLPPAQRAVRDTVIKSRDTNVHAWITASIAFPFSALGAGTTILDCAIFSCAQHLGAYPDINAHLEGDRVFRAREANIGFTLDSGGKLLIPVIQNASSYENARELAEARTDAMMQVERRRSGAQSDGPTFAVSHLHTRTLDHHYPRILPGNAAILAVATRDDEDRVNLCLAYDHRLVNGSYASTFLDDVATSLLECVR
jgi:pyruvate/2-oxoglutarate dehydrogenase complex dihydrolipoamide acyltransferase (E2) component